MGEFDGGRIVNACRAGGVFVIHRRCTLVSLGPVDVFQVVVEAVVVSVG